MLDVPTNPIDRYVYFRRLAQHIRAKRDIAYAHGQYAAAAELYNEARTYDNLGDTAMFEAYQRHNPITEAAFKAACDEFTGKEEKKWQKEEDQQEPEQVPLLSSEPKRNKNTASESSVGVWTLLCVLWRLWKRLWGMTS